MKTHKSHLAPLFALAVALAAAAACGGTTSTGVAGSSGSSGSTDDAGAAMDDGGAVCDPAPCAADGGTDPGFDTPTVCTSGTNWTRGDRGIRVDAPGRRVHHLPRLEQRPVVLDCRYGLPHRSRAGRLQRRRDHRRPDRHHRRQREGHEDRRQFRRKLLLAGAIALPFHAKVVVGTKERAMVAAQKSGDCNSCHTEKGDS